MLRTGKEHLERLRDGRVVYIGDERVHDVTAHAAFRTLEASMTLLRRAIDIVKTIAA